MGRFLAWGDIALKVIAPIVTVAISLLVAQWLIATKPEPPDQEDKTVLPAVEVARIRQGQVCFPVRSQGTVMPRTENTLVAQVPGRIVSVADCFDESRFFKKGDLLVQIDRRDYTVRIRRLEASLRATQAQTVEAKQARDRVMGLRQRNASPQADLDGAEAALEVAKARVAEFEAQLDEARNAEADTAIVAPFDGCVREKNVDVGKYVTAGTVLATCFATDVVEVRLPIDDDELAYLDLSLGVSFQSDAGPKVVLGALFGGETCRWEGNIVRTEAMVDRKSRMAYLVASVSSPYDVDQEGGGPPLAVGMFVEAVIRSRPIENAFVVPATCVESGGRILVVETNDQLKAMTVQVLRREGDWAVVRGELSDGQRVCTTHVEQAIDGIKVRVVSEFAGQELRANDDGVLDLCR